MTNDNVLAIDGPSGSGKSSVAKILAQRLKLIYIDTGAMFRAVAYALSSLPIDFSKEKLNTQDEKLIFDFFKNHRFSYEFYPSLCLKLDNLNLTDQIREHSVSALASKISRFEVIRDFLAKWQKQIVQNHPAILDGRDIGTIIFPNAKLKIFLTASLEKRAKRRQLELSQRGQDLSYELLLEDIKLRDHQDKTRIIAPLKKASDAVEIDSTNLELEDVINQIQKLWMEKQK